MSSTDNDIAPSLLLLFIRSEFDADANPIHLYVSKVDEELFSISFIAASLNIKSSTPTAEYNYRFTSSDKKTADLQERVKKVIHRKCMAPLLPPTGHLVLILYALLLIASSPNEFLEACSIPIFLKEYILMLFQRESIALLTLVVIFAIHAVEGIIVVYLLRSFLKDILCLVTWWLCAFIYGFSATRMVMSLCSWKELASQKSRKDY